MEITGKKSYRDGSRIIQQQVPTIPTINIPGQKTSFTVPNLLPKARYMFNITASFTDGARGPDQFLIAQTRIEGK